MKIYRVTVNATRSQYDERSQRLVHAPNAVKAIEKACREAKKDGCYKRYDAEYVELVGDAR